MVYCKTGRPEIANDVMGVHQTDVWTMLKPQDEWRPGLTRDALIEEMDKALTENVPGVKFGFSQPIEMRVNELVAGVKSDVAALIYGPDLDVLRRMAAEIERVLAQIPGAQDIKTPTSGRLPMLRVSVRRDQLARYGIKASDVLDAVAALGGHDGRHGLRGGQAAAPDPGPAARVVAERPRADQVDPGRRPEGPADRAARPGRRDVRGRPERGRARERPAPGGRRRERPGPRHRRLRRRGAGRDRRAR